MNLDQWESPDPGEVFTPVTDADWTDALGRYLGTNNDGPLLRCVGVARSNGARTMVSETRYMGPDYRSEYSAHYSRAFAGIPGSAHRLHLFREPLTADRLTDLPHEPGYLGYVVVRPSDSGAVARAMLLPPPDAVAAVRTAVQETVSFFGQPLTVSGVPFAQQDAQLGACAHAAVWMCHETARLRGDTGPRAIAEFALSADPSLLAERAVPTSGLTVAQVSDLLRRFGLPPMFYLVGRLPHPGLPWQPPAPQEDPSRHPGLWDTRIVPTACRHLNSGFPVLVGTHNHAFVLCGWHRDKANGRVRFVRHDDQQGPYLPVDDPHDDRLVHPDTGITREYGPWHTMHVPVPPKVWLLPESAERAAGDLLFNSSKAYAPYVAATTGLQVRDLPALAGARQLSFRTYTRRADHLKAGLRDRGYDATTTGALRLARLPKYVVVVEAIDKALRDQDQPAVVAEALFDATSHDIRPSVLVLRVHGVLQVWRTDGTTAGPVPLDPAAVRSGAVGGA